MATTDSHLTRASSWQQQLMSAITDLPTLMRQLQLVAPACTDTLAALQQFPLKVPYPYLSRIKPGDWDDPLLRQVLPLGIEMNAAPGYTNDPLGERDCNPVPGLLHKYRSRVLLTVTRSCAINCRYCFRRHFEYADNNPGQAGWQSAMDYIQAYPEVNEVILSGGDPLIAPDSVLHNLVRQLAELPQLSTLRVHTRLPVVIPARVTSSLQDVLCDTRLTPVMVLHCNHVNELDQDVACAISQLQARGVRLYNQSVLLRGVNDSVSALVALSQRLFDLNIQPYYLHCLDKIQGAAHFDVPESEAKQLYYQLLSALPGYMVPKLVRETKDIPYKSPVL